MTRSRIEAFDQTADVLTELATRLRAGSPRLQQAADVYVEQINTPNGAEWEGDTATRFSQEAQPDQQSVNRAVEHANAMADIAQRGGDYLRGARESTLEAITQAEEDDFTVGEDLSVSDNYVWELPAEQEARQAAAVAHRNYIAHQAARLEAANTSIAAQLNAGAAEMTAMTPAHWRQPNVEFGQPARRVPAHPNQNNVQAVDRIFKRDGGSDPQLPPGDTAGDAARRYEQTQRGADQAIVDKARREGRTHYQANEAGQPANMTDEEAAAQQRLKDYAAITDPTNRFGPGYEQQQAAQARRLAGERLEDYTKSKFVGPLPTDTLTGADARTRAQARLDLQHALEQGQVGWHPQPLTTDEATRLIDQMEAADRASVLAKMQQGLVGGGVSPGVAAKIADAIAQGTSPQEIIDGASSFGKDLAGGKEGFSHFAESLPTGQHWGAEVATFSPADIEALKSIGSRIGRVGSAIDLGAGLYELAHGAPAGEVVAKAGGGLAGAWGGGEAGAYIGSFAGPPGVFIGALVGGTAGAFGGEWLGAHGLKWLQE